MSKPQKLLAAFYYTCLAVALLNMAAVGICIWFGNWSLAAINTGFAVILLDKFRNQ